MNFHFCPDEAQKPDQARLILWSVLRLCFKTRTMIWSGDFNKSRNQMKEIVQAIAEGRHEPDIDGYGVENVKLHYDQAAPEIMLVLIKYKNPPWLVVASIPSL